MCHLFGTFVKKEQYNLVGAVNPKTGQIVENVLRSRLRTGSFNWADWSEQDRIDFLMAKFWSNELNAPPKDSLPE